MLSPMIIVPLLLCLSNVPVVLSADHIVVVGQDPVTRKQGIGFNPSTVNGVGAGDRVGFIFPDGSHTITEGTYETPCTPKQGGYDMGFVLRAYTGYNWLSTPMWVNITSSESRWFFEPIDNRCQQGLALLAVNPNDQQTVAQFVENAKHDPTESYYVTIYPNTAWKSAASWSGVAISLISTSFAFL